MEYEDSEPHVNANCLVFLCEGKQEFPLSKEIDKLRVVVEAYLKTKAGQKKLFQDWGEMPTWFSALDDIPDSFWGDHGYLLDRIPSVGIIVESNEFATYDFDSEEGEGT
jgi:hypothetical protein